ncbi:Sulfite reductase [NADPH] flavoprotein alpha-component [Variovorax boronicumulans]|uniref:flavodoxin domain-containing protein n=1 Tax=Variovorax boronicumulans TaxID=436515 RepID=UPI000BB39B67|nr:flavodoxin domain-containing protein [Variovorax boronicumulans]PBI87760.1 Sulfite reductase [NADPH] flavoprotein alpha-component [Variovorax boronicumulans]
MEKNLTILVASMSGTAEAVAEEVAALLQDQGWRSAIRLMDEISLDALRPGLYLICSSTYGTGEIPDNGRNLFDALETQRPDLSGLRYGVIGLGDSVYPQTFCFGGKRFDELWGALGAERIGERLDHDRRSPLHPDEAALAWAEVWVRQIDALEAA